MKSDTASRLALNEMTRRHFIWLTSMAAAGAVAGCATDPVTGKSQFMLVSESQEIQIDKQYSPLQFSSDYGITQDKKLNQYIERTGKQMAARTHRAHMPYSFQVVNATYVNAYAFPGGSIAITRGILLNLENEAELAALMGHELGHVNARHSAEQMSKGMLSQAVVGSLSAAADMAGPGYGQMASQLGQIGAGALLASYSRDNEREADALGLEYMTRSGYSSNGFVGLMDMLRSLNKRKPSAIELMFATHPMSDERYQTAVDAVQTKYQNAQGNPLYKERYMDNTARLRSIKGAIDAMQNGEKELVHKRYDSADKQFRKALKIAPRDYTALVLITKSKLMQENYRVAQHYADKAIGIYPQEAQAYHLSGFAKLKQRKFEQAYYDFNRYDQLLPGNPNTTFFKGYALEGMQRREEAADHYYKYLQVVKEGEKAKYAYQRLVQWGYVR